MQRFSRMSPVTVFNSSSPSIVAGAGTIKFQKALALSALFFSLLMLLSALAPLLRAQEVTGSIVGTVTDPSGAAISGATVTAKDVNRGTVLTTKTDETGAFRIERVPIGKY